MPCLLLILYGAYLIISPLITAITWAVILAILAIRLAAESPARAGDPRRQRFVYILQGKNIRGIILLIWCLGFVGIVDNIKPLLMGNRLGLPVLLLFFGTLGGLSLFGAVGIIIGPALFALLCALLDLFSQEYANADE